MSSLSAQRFRTITEQSKVVTVSSFSEFEFCRNHANVCWPIFGIRIGSSPCRANLFNDVCRSERVDLHIDVVVLANL